MKTPASDPNRHSNLIRSALLGSLLLTASCGTLLYPERRDLDQADRGLDAAVVAMDGILLLFGILPGVIAFAVDAHTGAIYLPPGVDAPETPEVLDVD